MLWPCPGRLRASPAASARRSGLRHRLVVWIIRVLPAAGTR
jgi:hypothetical protein